LSLGAAQRGAAMMASTTIKTGQRPLTLCPSPPLGAKGEYLRFENCPLLRGKECPKRRRPRRAGEGGFGRWYQGNLPGTGCITFTAHPPPSESLAQWVEKQTHRRAA